MLARVRGRGGGDPGDRHPHRLGARPRRCSRSGIPGSRRREGQLAPWASWWRAWPPAPWPPGGPGRGRRLVAKVAGVVVAAMGFSRCSSTSPASNLGIDQILFQRAGRPVDLPGPDGAQRRAGLPLHRHRARRPRHGDERGRPARRSCSPSPPASSRCRPSSASPTASSPWTVSRPTPGAFYAGIGFCLLVDGRALRPAADGGDAASSPAAASPDSWRGGSWRRSSSCPSRSAGSSSWPACGPGSTRPCSAPPSWWSAPWSWRRRWSTGTRSRSGTWRPIGCARGDERKQREWLRITLASIGDAVIATDVRGASRS